MMHGFGFNGFGSLGWIGMVLNLVIFIVVVIGIVWFITWMIRRSFPGGFNNTHQVNSKPVEILQARYARGEINREEYEQIKSDLS